jgi:predicted glycoside hydrolase/deacetylase ChbG (UPF0249 family)
MHADDFAISPGVTREIIRCIDEGPIRSVSVIANGVAFEEAINALRERPHVAVSVHLNLREGRPLSDGLRHCVDAAGLLRGSFAKFMLRDHSQEARAEWSAQVARVRKALPGRSLRLDSHGHIHHIPSLFEVARDLCLQVGASLRLVREPHFVSRNQTASGVFKHVVLNAMSAAARSELRGVCVDDWVVGSLFTGHMNAEALDAALLRIDEGSVEVVFHPCAAAPGEEEIWAAYPDLRAYYFAPERRLESERLRAPELRLGRK